MPNPAKARPFIDGRGAGSAEVSTTAVTKYKAWQLSNGRSETLSPTMGLYPTPIFSSQINTPKPWQCWVAI
jgi:hypothetical protein